MIELNNMERYLRKQALQRHPELNGTDFFDEASLDEQEEFYKEMAKKFMKQKNNHKKEIIKERASIFFVCLFMVGAVLFLLTGIVIVFL